MQNIDERIKAIDWEKYETFYGNANEDVSITIPLTISSNSTFNSSSNTRKPYRIKPAAGKAADERCAY